MKLTINKEDYLEMLWDEWVSYYENQDVDQANKVMKEIEEVKADKNFKPLEVYDTDYDKPKSEQTHTGFIF